MRKLMAIFLLLQVCTNNAFAEELIRVPRLFTHYYHHSQEHKDINNFSDFLHLHYSDHHKTNEHSHGHDDEDNDCNLPFKHCDDCCVSAHAPAVGPLPNLINTDKVIHAIEKRIFNLENSRIQSSNICNIWQPPKVA